jgi:polysaccharide export outer membrane protein
LLGLALIPLLSGCGGSSLSGAPLAQGAQAYTSIAPAASAPAADRDYKIGAQDALVISVYQEPDLSTPPNAPLQVNASGNITMPLIGTVHAAGMTAAELSAVIADRFSTNFLRNPQVTVSVAGAVSQTVTVQGAVQKAGVYEIKGRTTLLQAIAMAEGETKTAELRQVAIFRTVNGQPMGALFNVEQIRRGQAADPEILGQDKVIVADSKSKAAWRDILNAAPLINIFRPF